MLLKLFRAAVTLVMAGALMPAAFAQDDQVVTDDDVTSLTALAAAEPLNPEAHYAVAVANWMRACSPRNRICEASAASDDLRGSYVAAGLAAVDQALQLQPDYIDALAYRNLLLRSQASLEPAHADQLIQEADALLTRIRLIQQFRKPVR